MTEQKIFHRTATTISITVILLSLTLFCKKQELSTGPVQPETFKWGENPEAMDADLTGLGWSKLSRTGETVDYSLKMNDKEEKFDPIMDQIVYPYKVSLYFNKNRLHAARLFRTGKAEEINEFKNNFLKVNSFSEPAWKNTDADGKTEGGNTYSSYTEIYSGKDIIAKLHKNTFISNENSVRDDSIDIQIYSIKENEGISVKGLAEIQK